MKKFFITIALAAASVPAFANMDMQIGLCRGIYVAVTPSAKHDPAFFKALESLVIDPEREDAAYYRMINMYLINPYGAQQTGKAACNHVRLMAKR